MRVTYDYIQTHTVIHRLYTNIFFTYKYLGATYDGRRVINMKCTIFLFTFHLTWAQVMSCTHTRARESATHARVPHTFACATFIRSPYALLTRAKHAQTDLSTDVIWCDVARQINGDYDDSTQDLAHANVSKNYFPRSDSIVKASGCVCV